ncbi:MAG: 1-(5-phosphoribosyl)-5-((5-phosphoribosylamino)methylideneamino)imidazole-4-carboxamide isomerase [Sulfobacillus thermosulfidooxidans]|uniref:1-(5-phosphoribosyl)-5-[(5-phosphoribosylamino)methylideneamino] imidazole-4-carboxamide isomerase n=1 Tax=Sulfobacillus thermotolerans TaxID=338644 RepID=A0ABN5GXR6_9FIRM|nr:1-(5-phosphoribosyl)-5-((5-phosphoribosylamino)methylideneamino)imidazole-4-carboxamide isomerase [Sulfobacillus thermotolerans]MCY0907383.1 HisA/HisF-related TIM barrel protein [Sulfobacillus thermotolerans]PSR36025.1 MAG: 1-(5-phosphoribosyl)-5-((5-phosphoribosylamino)methylideneamino)imidazole-4-carboxamide isomerase [Sulfobacillus thermosulfidooxidans]
MEIWPAVDWFDGQMVRLERGSYNRVTAYTDDPLALFQERYHALPKRIHLVDLKGAKDGSFSAWPLLERMARLGIDVEVGGGFRETQQVQKALDSGACRVVLGTRLIEDKAWAQDLLHQFGPHKLVASIDIKDGRAMLRGWTTNGLAADTEWFTLYHMGFTLCNITDISRDGTLIGLDPAFWRETGQYPGEIGAGGGIAHMEDLALLEAMGIGRAVIGKAWVSGQIDLHQCKGVF